MKKVEFIFSMIWRPLLKTSTGHVFVYGGENISGQSGDAQMVIEKIESFLSEPVLCEKVKAIITDSAGPYAKARREFSKLRPDIAFLPCFAHQLNLTIGDMFKSFPEFKETLDTAGAIVAFFNRSVGNIERLRQAAGPGFRSLKSPCDTRWSSQFACLCSVSNALDHIEVGLDRLFPHTRSV
jgi:hypothetical protein